MTYWLARATQRIARVAQDELEAGSQPYVTVQHDAERGTITVMNLGRGPALNGRYCYFEMHGAAGKDLLTFYQSPVLNLPASIDPTLRELKVESTDQPEPWVFNVLCEGQPSQDSTSHVWRLAAFVCQDQFGFCHYFGAQPGEHRMARTPREERPLWGYWPPRTRPEGARVPWIEGDAARYLMDRIRLTRNYAGDVTDPRTRKAIRRSLDELADRSFWRRR
jgi:hypothetical protein